MRQRPISLMSPGEKGEIVCLEWTEKSKLMALGILPGIRFEIVRTFPAYIIRIGYTEIAFDSSVAEKILAKKI